MRILCALREETWGIRDLLVAYVRDTDKDGQEIRLEYKGHTTAKSRRKWVARALNAPELQDLIGKSVQGSTETFNAELKALRASADGLSWDLLFGFSDVRP
jgi:hypothetical protein